jgi:outer membrane protein, heavy metal efflux system
MALASIALAGCVAIPADRGAADTDALVAARSVTAGSVRLLPESAEAAAEFTSRLLNAPIGATEAVQLALLNNPRMRLLYAELGLAQGEVYDATRFANPTLGYLRLVPDVGSGSKTTWSISQGFTELLFLGYRNRVGRAQAIRAEQQVAHAVLQLEADVREAFYTHASAQLAARMRAAVARGARSSADLAARFHSAGNITILQRSREEAAASNASIGARKLAVQALEARGRLLTMLGLSMDDASPRFVEELGLPVAMVTNIDVLQSLADRQRLDLAALRTEAGLRQQQLKHVSRWRWLGGLVVDAERERELDGAVLSGPGASIEIPIFNTGRGTYLKSSASAEGAAARLTGLQTEIRNNIAVEFATLESSHLVVDEYRLRLLPLQERIVDTSQREQNFMLIGAFELLAARREEVEAYEQYVDAVRDYWIARTRLARSVGGTLPGDEARGELLKLPDVPGQELPEAPAQSIPGGAQ